MLKKQTITGTCLVTETTTFYELTLGEHAVLEAPAGKFVAMTVNGVGCDPNPSHYQGDIVLTVSEQYHMEPHSMLRLTGISKEFSSAVVVTDGHVQSAQGVPAIVHGGSVTDREASGVYIASSAESFNGILVTGDSDYTVRDSRMELEGFGENDFMGMGAGVAAIDNARVTVDNCDITISGVTRCAVHVGGDSQVLIKNSRLQNLSPDSDWLGDFSWACGFTGTNRLCQLTDNGSVRYENCELKGNGWGLLSIDGTDRHNELLVKNCRMELSGPRSHGYGAFCIGGNHVQLDGCDVNVTGYPLLLRGMEGQGRAEILRSRIRGRRFGVLAMGDTHSILTISDSDFETDQSTLVFKGSATNINITNTDMRPQNGVILQLMDNDEGGMRAQNFKIPVGETDQPVPGRDLTTAGSDDICVSLSRCTMTGNFFNSTTNIRACKRSDMGGLGKFHDTVIGIMKPPPMPEGTPPAEAPDPTALAVDLDGPKNLLLRLEHSRVTGQISSAGQKYRDGLTIINEANRLEMSNITQWAAPTVNNGVIVTLDGDSRWIVTGDCYLSRLELAPGAVVSACAGSTLTMLVDGMETAPLPGCYTGKIELHIQ